jgi:hypothetical protein
MNYTDVRQLQFKLLSRVNGDYIRRGLDWQLDLLDPLHSYTQLQYTHYSRLSHKATLHSLQWQRLLSLCSTTLSRLSLPTTHNCSCNSSLPLKTLAPTLLWLLTLSTNWRLNSELQASSSLLVAFASMVILGVEPHLDPWPYFCSHI